MENKDKKISNGIKIIGVGLLLLVVPGSTLALPWLIQKFIKDSKKDSSNEILGI
jgi:hypothetical protein